MSRARPLFTAVLISLALGGCTMPQWNPAWVPAWVPYLGEDRGAPLVQRPPAKPRVIQRPIARDEGDEPMERVVAVVNNDAITLGELEEALAASRQDRSRPPAGDEQLKREFLNRFIETRLQLQEAEREKIIVEEAEVDDELNGRLQKSNVKDIEEFKRMLKVQGLSYDAVRKRLRDSLKTAKVVRRKVGVRVSVTDVEIERYLEENRLKLETGLGYHARHILIVPEGGLTDSSWEGARIRAELVRSQLRDGGDFAELARKNSGDATAKDGGDLGVLQRGELAQDIETRILALSPGKVSEPYRSDLGYHIFLLESKEALEGDGLVRAKSQIREILFRQKYEARLDAWLREIRERAIIEVRM